MPRRESASSARKTAKAQLTPQIIALRRQSQSWRYIGDMLGIAHETAREWYRQGILEFKETTEEEALQVYDIKQDMLGKLTAVIDVWHPRAVSPIVDEDGKVVGMDSEAAAVTLKYIEQVAKFLGLHAPVKTDLTSKGEALAAPAPVDLSRLSGAELTALETIYAKAGVLRLPGSDEAA